MSVLLSIKNLHVSIAGKTVVNGINLNMREGEVHVIMGPNGSGKSSLVHALMGHPAYHVDCGEVYFHDKNLLALTPEDRAKAGLFLAFQYPREITGVTLQNFLRFAINAIGRERCSPITFKRLLTKHMKSLRIDPSFADRFINKGFSGGEKKKAEILQLTLLRPRLALLDETDSGLDVDALKIVADGINTIRKPKPPFDDGKDKKMSVLLVTHYARILRHIIPDHVHVMVEGRIQKSGGKDLANRLEREGYEKLKI